MDYKQKLENTERSVKKHLMSHVGYKAYTNSYYNEK
jgi:hypothetical protein